MGGIWLGLIAALVGAVVLMLWRRHRQQRRQITRHSMRCPMHDTRADLTMVTDPAARAGRQYLAVSGCSLFPGAAATAPERVAYVCDGEPYKARLEPSSPTPVHTAKVSCRQPCVEVLNATAVSATPLPIQCASGFSDAITLAEQAVGPGRMSRLLWYAGF